MSALLGDDRKLLGAVSSIRVFPRLPNAISHKGKVCVSILLLHDLST